VNEIYITCGMLTGGRQPDLMSFFWRQVVAASPADSTRSAAYENGWNAINQFIREGYSWSGNQANIFYKKLGGRYADASLQSGLDIAGDARAFAFVDLDDDGCVDLLLKCRLGPQLRVFQNRVGQEQRRIAFQLEGVKSNRDAIGARVEVNGRVRWLNAGSGYLSQHSKTVFIGLGNDERIERASILWPSGLRQPLEGLQMDSLYRVREGDSPVLVRGFAKSGFAKSGSAKSLSLPERTVAGENQQRLHDTWFVEPIPLPEPQRGPGLYVVDGAAASPAFALFRRYLFEYRADLEPRLALLLDARGHAVKVYAQVPDAARVAADLRTTPRPLPYPGRSLNPMRRDFFKLGAALLGCGYREEALPYLEEVLRRDPANHTARVLAAQVHREAGRWDQARSSLRLVLDAAPQIAEAWNELGGVEQGQYADHKKALECFEQAVAWKPDLVYALLNAAQSAARLQDLAKARDLYERALAASPRNAAAHNGLGLLLAQSGESAKAEVHFRDAVKHDAALGGAWNNLAVLLLRQRREPEALQVLREGIRQAPGEELLYLNLGRILLQQGDRQGARAVMEQLLKTNPGSAVARKALEDLRNPER
jgi:tetratricopeptide (TPR) repeat protein